jgi:hypothetical protein
MELRPSTEYSYDADVVYCEPWGDCYLPEPRRKHTRCRTCGLLLNYRNNSGYCMHGNCTPQAAGRKTKMGKCLKPKADIQPQKYNYVGRDADYGRTNHYPEKLGIARSLGYPDFTTGIEGVYAATQSMAETAEVFKMSKAGMELRMKLIGIVRRSRGGNNRWAKIGRDCR